MPGMNFAPSTVAGLVTLAAFIVSAITYIYHHRTQVLVRAMDRAGPEEAQNIALDAAVSYPLPVEKLRSDEVFVVVKKEIESRSIRYRQRLFFFTFILMLAFLAFLSLVVRESLVPDGAPEDRSGEVPSPPADDDSATIGAVETDPSNDPCQEPVDDHESAVEGLPRRPSATVVTCCGLSNVTRDLETLCCAYRQSHSVEACEQRLWAVFGCEADISRGYHTDIREKLKCCEQFIKTSNNPTEYRNVEQFLRAVEGGLCD
jgi:hypothetical protein